MASDSIAMDYKMVDNDKYINPATGDFDIVPSDSQHIKDLLSHNQGEYKQFPLSTINLVNLLKGKINQQNIESEIKSILEADGYKSSGRPVVNTSPDKIQITPNATRIKF